MTEIEQVKLSEFFKSVKCPRYILGTTYTLSLAFFESAVFSDLDRRQLKYCLIISDSHGYQRSLEEGPALQLAAQGYMVVPAPAPGCFHAKVWLIIGESEAALLVGSGNLTQSGFMTNAELFDSLSFSTESPPTQDQFASVTSFLSGLAAMWSVEDRSRLLSVDMLAEIRREFGTFARANQTSEPDAPRFIHSFAGPLLSQLPEPAANQKLLIAAPYFGNSTKGLELLQTRYSPSSTQVFPAVQSDETTDFPVSVFKGNKKTSVSRLAVKGKKSFAHLKLYGGIEKTGRAWLCCTSANCTVAAWQGTNKEAGLIRRVTPETVAGYFTPDKAPLPAGKYEYNSEGDYKDRLHIWAGESGQGIDITISKDSASRLPLDNVVLTIRIGSNTAKMKCASIFASGRTEHVPWSAFEAFRRTPNMAICLELQGRDVAGTEIKGGCFVENRMLLTADPIHRSAWRGALALLDTETMPDLSDIAAIFTLVTNIFDGRLVSRSSGASHAPAQQQGSEDDGVIHVPIWPPQPDDHDLHHKIGSTGLGQLELCQKILSTLLKPQSLPSHKHSAKSTLDESEGDTASDGDDSGKALHIREAEEGRAKKLAQHLWDRADRDYTRLQYRLEEIMPTEEIAPNIWPASVFVFLATTAIHRATSRICLLLEGKMSLQDLIAQFVATMLKARPQPPDFCVPKNFRYRSETFPPLANDLRETFKVVPDIDIATVMVAILVAHKMWVAPNNEYPVMWRKLLSQVVGHEFQPSDEFTEATLRIWSQYLCDDNGSFSEEGFVSAYTTIWQAYRSQTP